MTGKEKLYPIIGRNLKKLCHDNGLSKRELQDKLSTYGNDYNVTIKAIGGWFSGKNAPTMNKFYVLCEILRCSADSLLGRIDERNHDLEYIKKETGLTEKTIKAMRLNKGIAQSIESLLLEDFNQRTKDNYWGQFNTVLTLITDYLDTKDSQTATLKMLDLQQHLIALRNMKQTAIKSKTRNLF